MKDQAAWISDQEVFQTVSKVYAQYNKGGFAEPDHRIASFKGNLRTASALEL
jgi:hypothetical protein